MEDTPVQEPKYGGYTRFELELEVCKSLSSIISHYRPISVQVSFLGSNFTYHCSENSICFTCVSYDLSRRYLILLKKQFVQSLSNPLYLNHLASQKLLDTPEMIAYLDYLQYFKDATYIKYLS